MPNINESDHKLFFHLGSPTAIDEDGKFENQEHISIGNNVSLLLGYHLQAGRTGQDPSPTIIIGDNCWCNRYFKISAVNRIELKKNVLIGPNVCLSDYDLQEGNPGWSVSTDNRIELGESCWLGANTVVRGKVRIGRGSVIGANSLVLRDIPDYCVATGVPAAVARIYDTVSGDWVRVKQPEEMQRILANRRQQPLLSICLTASGGSTDLEACLQSIYAQIDDCDLFEICVTRSVEDEETDAVLNRYQEQYVSLKLIPLPLEKFSLADRLVQTMAHAKGAFIMPQFHLHPFEADKLIPFLNVIHHSRLCSFIWVNGNREFKPTPVPVTEHKQGKEAFALALSRFGASGASIAVEREAWQRVAPSAPLSEMSSVQWSTLLIDINSTFCLYDGCM